MQTACHQRGGSSTFIGPTLRNLNRTVTRGGDELNQLAYLRAAGVLGDGDLGAAMPDYRDESLSLATRARAYLDINCAHCHNPDAWDESSRRDIDFRYTTPMDQTGIGRESRSIGRVLRAGEMPYLGTTLQHDEGVGLVLKYLDSL